MATYSNNTTIKISAATALSVNTGGGFTGTVTAYTCPAGCYAEFYLYAASIGAASSMVVAGQTIIPASTAYATPSPITANFMPPKFVLTPGQTVQVVDGSGVSTSTRGGSWQAVKR